jgi:hypothetical protein
MDAGLTVDDRQMLVAHFVVFLVACFQLQANMSAGILDARSLHVANIPGKRSSMKQLPSGHGWTIYASFSTDTFYM